jgi:hypothetical protein
VKKTFELEFPFKADEPSLNGRIYPREVLEKAIAERQQAISERRMFGELGSDTVRVRLEHTSHLITGLRLEGAAVKGDVEAFPTEKGKILQAMHDEDIPMELCPVGRGDVDPETGIISNYTLEFVNITPKDE